MSHATPLTNPGGGTGGGGGGGTAGGGSYDVINVTESPYNAAGDGVTDDRSAIQTAITAATATGQAVYIPPGTYICGRSGSSGWSLDIPANLTIFGVRGQTWLQLKAGMSSTPCALMRFNQAHNTTIRELGFHGNWGNGYTTIAQASHNVVLPQATINVVDNSDFTSSGTFVIITSAGAETITYTGKTGTTAFTGCTGGTGTMFRGQELCQLDDKTGINHTTQTDPQSHGIMCRGTKNASISRCLFKQIYGDGIWTGAGPSSLGDWTQDLSITECDFETCARDGVSVAQGVDGLHVFRCQMRNIFAQAIDGEPVDQPARNVTVEKCKLGLWFNPANVSRTTNSSCSIVGGKFLAPSVNTYARNWAVRDCDIYGSVVVETAQAVVIEHNRIICDFSGESYAPVQVRTFCDDITIHDNTIYDRTTFSGGGTVHQGSIDVSFYGSGTVIIQPIGIKVTKNKIFARNGNVGVDVRGTGSHAYSTGAPQADETNVATSITNSTLVRTGATWTSNQWEGWSVRVGDAHAVVASNTADTLTLYTPHMTATTSQLGWYTFHGGYHTIPAAGTYTLYRPDGWVTVEGNEIDCSNDGHGGGGYGIGVYGDYTGMRVIVKDNQILNAGTYAIEVDCTDANRAILDLVIKDNTAWDNQGTPTCTTAVHFTPTTYVTSLTMRGNRAGTGVTTLLGGLTTGTWLLDDGYPAEWAGFGSPESVVTAPVGSTYLRVDGASGTCRYTKTSGTGNTGWTPTGVKATGSITCTTKANYVDTDYMTIGDGISAPKLYEFDTAGDGVTSGRIQVNISGSTSATDVATVLAAAIAANQPALSVSQASGVLTLTHKLIGTLGNVTITENVANAGHTVSGMSGGVDGPG